MVIGIIGAMEMEIEGLKSQMTGVKTDVLSSISFFTGLLMGQEVVVAKCSPGKVNAAICAQTMIFTYHPACIINPGVAGGIGAGLSIGDLVVGSCCVQHDMDTSEIGDPIGEIPTNRGGIIELPCHKGLSALFMDRAAGVYPGKVTCGVIATGDQFVASSAKCHWIREQFGAIACEMESGSIAQVCYLNDLPFVALRSISDNADEDGAVDFPAFARASAEKTVALLNATIMDIKI